jgi:hypothetical protein
MTTQTARKGEPGHIREDRERVGRTPRTRWRVYRWSENNFERVSVARPTSVRNEGLST